MALYHGYSAWNLDSVRISLGMKSKVTGILENATVHVTVRRHWFTLGRQHLSV